MLNWISNYSKLISLYAICAIRVELQRLVIFIVPFLLFTITQSITVVFFIFFFDKFPVSAQWNPSNYAILWSLGVLSASTCSTCFANARQLSTIIIEGRLDTWMVYPKPMLFHLLISQFNPYPISGILSGYLIFVIFAHPSLLQIIFFILAGFLSSLIRLAFIISFSTLAFFIDVSGLSEEAGVLVTNFSSYPGELFKGFTKILVFTVIPTAFIIYLPVQAISLLDITPLLYCVLATVGFLSISWFIFHIGLKRYQSGNMMQMHR